MDNSLNKVTYMGETDFRNQRTRFGIKNIDRARHMYVIGKTGMGKSTLLENMAAQDIQNGAGICFVDPHGSSAELLLEYVPESRIQDVLYFAPFDTDFPVAFNPLEDVDPDKRHLVASGLMSAFKKIWVDAFSARMEYILSNAILALLEYPESTLLSVNRMLVEKEFRKTIVDNISDPTVKAFWVDEYEKWDDRYRKEAGAAIQNKVGQFVSNPLIRNIVGQPKSSFDLREMMDNKKILIVNLSKGQIGEQNAGLLGGMFITKLYLAAMSRADLERSAMEALPPFYFYVDEFQSFANESFADILSEARKYKLALTIAHQYVAQMPDEVREAVFGNIGSMVVFRVGPGDAEHFEREFAPVFTEQDIVNVGRFQYYLRLMIDGMGSSPFSAVGFPPLDKPATSNKRAVIEMSRERFADKRADVDKKIADWYVPIPSEKDKEHQAYIEKKKAEFAAEGKEWVDFSKDTEKKAEYSEKKGKQEYQKPAFSKNFKKDFPKKEFSPKYSPQIEKKQVAPAISPKLESLLKAVDIDTDDIPKKENNIPEKVFVPTKSTNQAPSSSSFPKKELERKASTEKVLSLKEALLRAGIGAVAEVADKKEKIVENQEVVENNHFHSKFVEPKSDAPKTEKSLSQIPVPARDSGVAFAEEKKEEVTKIPVLESNPKYEDRKVEIEVETPIAKSVFVEPQKATREETSSQKQEEQVTVASSGSPKYSPDDLLEMLLKD